MIEPVTARDMKNDFFQMQFRVASKPSPAKRAKDIVSNIAELHMVSVRELLGNDRARYVAHPRQDAYRLIKLETGWSLPRIGQMFDRDHTTILYGIRQSEKRAEASQ